MFTLHTTIIVLPLSSHTFLVLMRNDGLLIWVGAR